MKSLINTILFVSILLISCSSNSNNNNGIINEFNVAGTWQVTKYTFTKQRDINGNGTSQTNFISEIDCYKLEINFESSGKFTLKQKDIKYILDNKTCNQDEIKEGFYLIKGNSINLYKSQTDSISDTNKDGLVFIIVGQEMRIIDTNDILGEQVRVLKRK